MPEMQEANPQQRAGVVGIMPYINLKKETCHWCSRPARLKAITIPYGVYIAVCSEHLTQLAELLQRVYNNIEQELLGV